MTLLGKPDLVACKERQEQLWGLYKKGHVGQGSLCDAAAVAGTVWTFCVLRDVRFSNRPFGVKRFQASANAVSRPLAGSCFSSESAPRPFWHSADIEG